MARFNAVPPPDGIYNVVSPPADGTTAPGPGATSTAAPAEQHHHQHQHTPSAASSVTLDIEAWTVAALESLSIDQGARGTGMPLSIAIDGPSAPGRPGVTVLGPDHPAGGGTPPRRPLSRRDSQKRREAILKGNAGSRARRRWDNDRLHDVPNVQPPLPSDWLPHATHPVHVVPYAMAQLWDRGGLRQRVEAAADRRRRGLGRGRGGLGVGCVPRELRNTAKHTPALKGWVRVLEEPVRRFLGEGDGGGEDDGEEIVFPGRAALGLGLRNPKPARREVQERVTDKGVVFDELGDDESGAFKRWLTHSISDYYGLVSRSITAGEPPRRVVYVGKHHSSPTEELPPPMWELF